MKKIFFKYLIISFFTVSTLILIFYCRFLNFEKSLELTYKIIQIFAILIAGFWTYETFFLHKKIESALRIKVMLNQYKISYNFFLSQYRINEDWIVYATSMMPVYNKFLQEINGTAYLPGKIRSTLDQILFLSINNGNSPSNEDFNVNIDNFENKLDLLKKELDLIINF